jgi:hypothetical protein
MNSIVEKSRTALNLEQFVFHNERVPMGLRGGIERYVEHGILPGHFLRAIICNDLKDAVQRADTENMFLIAVYVAFFYNYCPSGCWGSKERMLEWSAGFNEGRIKNEGVEE